jgi:hypothetical protein
MRIRACCRNYITTNDDGEADRPTLKIHLAAPGGSRYVELACVFDTGSSEALSIPLALVGALNDLGLEFPDRGVEVVSTANGDAQSIVSGGDIIVDCLNGRPISFFDVEIAVDEGLDVPLVGMGLLRFFNIGLINGELRNFEFNDGLFQ